MSKQISGSLKDARLMLDVVGRNIDNTQVAGSRAVDTSIKMSPLGKSGAYRTSVVSARRDDPLKTKVLFSSITSASKTQTKSVSLSFLQSVIGSGSDLQKSLLVRSVTDFISQSKVLPAVDDISMKRAFIDKGVALTDALNNATDRVNSLRVDADNDLQKGLVQLNTSLKSLNLLNQKIITSRSPEMLHDNRDSLIREISQKLDVQVFYGHNGVANLAIKGGGHELVSATNRAEFSYPGAKTSDILYGGTIPAITITKIHTENGKDRVLSAPTPIVGGSDNPVLQGMKGGQVEGWIQLRDVELPLAGDAIKSLSIGVAKSVNAIHNNGSSYPPKTIFRGSKSVSGDQVLDLEGKVTFFAVDSKGAQLKGGAGKLNPATIDFSKFKGSGIDGGKPTVSELIAEINQKLSKTPSADRVAIGEISSSGGQVDGQYLVNNIQLAGMGDIDINGRWTFDLDLQGNSYFGSRVEVLQVDPPIVPPGPARILPPAFRLDASTDTRTGGGITVDLSGGAVDVTVKIRVTGDNGVVQEGDVTFHLDPALARLNQRIPFSSAIAPTGGFVTDGLLSHSGVATAMLVDANGDEISNLATNVPGYLVIKTNSSDYRLAIQNGDISTSLADDGNFSTLFELNNFFDFDEITGKITVNKSVNEDPMQLATGMVSLNRSTPTTVKVGDVAAKASLAFGVNFTDGDVVEIDGQIFTFRNAPAGVGQVQIDPLSLENSLRNLMVQINANPASRFTAEVNGGKISLAAKVKGVFGNSLQMRANLAQPGGQTLAMNNGEALVVLAGADNNANFTGGTDKDSSIEIADYTIGSGSYEIFTNLQQLSSINLDFIGLGSASGEFSSTIEQFATLVSGAVSGQYNQAKSEDDVLQTAFESLNQEMTKLFGPDLYEQYFYSLELKEFMTAVANYGKMVQNITDRVLDILF